MEMDRSLDRTTGETSLPGGLPAVIVAASVHRILRRETCSLRR